MMISSVAETADIAVTVPRTDRYKIRIRDGLVARLGAELREAFGAVSAVVISDRNVWTMHGDKVAASLGEAGIPVDVIVLPAGERTKSLHTANKVYRQLLDLRARRRTVLIAFGGGMVIDTVGFIAATYLRGVPYINVPTSLLAQVDSAIGGKVAVNHPAGKNLVGAFHHPSFVYTDPSVLLTSSDRDLRSGMAEVVKTAVIADEALFGTIERGVSAILARDTETLAVIINRTSLLKVELLSGDPYEADLRRPLNFGHTVGHAVEKEEGYGRMRHGEAVAVGMAVAARIAVDKGVCPAATGERIVALIRALGLPVWTRVPVERIWEAVTVIRMVRDGHLHYVLPGRRLGEVVMTNDIDASDIARALAALED